MFHFKICCIQDVSEAEMALLAGARAVGLVGPMPSGPGPIHFRDMAPIMEFINNKVETFLLSSKTKSSEIIEEHSRVGSSAIQLVDAVSIETCKKLRAKLNEVKLVQVIHVMDKHSIEQAKEMAPYVDELLLDSGNPGLAVKQLGGTGKVHNWEISRELVQLVDIPVWLAGGLNPENVERAIETVKPYGVDVCSGLRKNGALMKNRLQRFARNVNRFVGGSRIT